MENIPVHLSYLNGSRSVQKSLLNDEAIHLGEDITIHFPPFKQSSVDSLLSKKKILFSYQKRGNPPKKLSFHMGEDTPLFQNIKNLTGTQEERALASRQIILKHIAVLVDVHEIGAEGVEEIRAGFEGRECQTVLAGEKELGNIKRIYGKKNRKILMVKQKLSHLALEETSQKIVEKVRDFIDTESSSSDFEKDSPLRNIRAPLNRSREPPNKERVLVNNEGMPKLFPSSSSENMVNIFEDESVGEINDPKMLAEHSLLQNGKGKLSKQLRQRLDHRTAFHLLSDSWGKDRLSRRGESLEGHSSTAMLSYMSSFTKEMKEKSPHSKVYQKIHSQYEDAAQFSAKFDCVEPGCLGGFIETDVFNAIKGLKTSNGKDTCCFPMGWSGYLPGVGRKHPGHAMLLEVHKYLDSSGQEKFALSVLNTGGGLEFHSKLSLDKKEKYEAFVNWDGLDAEDLMDQSLWQEILEAKKVPDWYPKERAYYDAKHIYGPLLNKWGRPSSEKKKVGKKEIKDFISSQRAGTCTKKSTDQIARLHLSKKEYKYFKIEAKLYALVNLYERFTDPKDEFFDNVDIFEMIQKSVENISGSLMKALNRGVLANMDESSKSVLFATVFDLSQKVQESKGRLFEKNALSMQGGLPSIDQAILIDHEIGKRKEMLDGLEGVHVQKPLVDPLEKLKGKKEVPEIHFPKDESQIDGFLDSMEMFRESILSDELRPPQGIVAEMQLKLFKNLPLPNDSDSGGELWKNFSEKQSFRCLKVLSELTHHSFALSMIKAKTVPYEVMLNNWKMYRIGITLTEKCDPSAKDYCFSHQYLDEIPSNQVFQTFGKNEEREFSRLCKSFHLLDNEREASAKDKHPVFCYKGMDNYVHDEKYSEFDWLYRKYGFDKKGVEAVKGAFIGRRKKENSSYGCSNIWDKMRMSDEESITSYQCLKEMSYYAQCGTSRSGMDLSQKNFSYDDGYFNLEKWSWGGEDSAISNAVVNAYLSVDSIRDWGYYRNMRDGSDYSSYITDLQAKHSNVQASVIEMNRLKKGGGWWRKKKFSSQSCYEYGAISQTQSPVNLSLLMDKFEREPELLLTKEGRNYFANHVLSQQSFKGQVKREVHTLKRIVSFLKKQADTSKMIIVEGKKNRSEYLDRCLISYRLLGDISKIVADLEIENKETFEKEVGQTCSEIHGKLKNFFKSRRGEFEKNKEHGLNKKIVTHLLAYWEEDGEIDDLFDLIKFSGRYPLLNYDEDSSLVVNRSLRLYQMSGFLEKIMESDQGSRLLDRFSGLDSNLVTKIEFSPLRNLEEKNMKKNVWYGDFPRFVRKEGPTLFSIDVLEGTLSLNGIEDVISALPIRLRESERLDPFGNLKNAEMKKNELDEFVPENSKHNTLSFCNDASCSVKLKIQGDKTYHLLSEEDKVRVMVQLNEHLWESSCSIWKSEEEGGLYPLIIAFHDEEGMPTPAFYMDRNGVLLSARDESKLLVSSQGRQELNIFEGICFPEKDCLLWKDQREGDEINQVDISLKTEKGKWLSFKRYPGREKLRWEEDPSYCLVSRNRQKLPKFIDHPHFLLLENEDQKKTKAIMNQSKISDLRKGIQGDEISLDVSQPPDGVLKKQCFSFDVTPLGELQTDSVRGNLYLSYLKLMEGSYDEAMKYLKEATPLGRRYNSQELELMQWIVSSNKEIPDNHPGASAVRVLASWQVYERFERFPLSGKEYYQLEESDKKSANFFLLIEVTAELKEVNGKTILDEEYTHYSSYSLPSQKWSLDEWIPSIEQWNLISLKFNPDIRLGEGDEALVERINFFDELSQNLKGYFEGGKGAIIQEQLRRLKDLKTWSGKDFSLLFIHLNQGLTSLDPLERRQARENIEKIMNSRTFELEREKDSKRYSLNRRLYSILEYSLKNPVGRIENAEYFYEQVENLWKLSNSCSRAVKDVRSFQKKDDALKLFDPGFSSSYYQLEMKVQRAFNAVDFEDLEKCLEGVDRLSDQYFSQKGRKVLFGDKQFVMEASLSKLNKLRASIEGFLGESKLEEGASARREGLHYEPEGFSAINQSLNVFTSSRGVKEVENLPLTLLNEVERKRLSEEDLRFLEEMESDFASYLQGAREEDFFTCNEENIPALKGQIEKKKADLDQMLIPMEADLLQLANKLSPELFPEERLEIHMGRIKGTHRTYDVPHLIGMLLQSKKNPRVWDEFQGFSSSEKEEIKHKIIDYLSAKNEMQHCSRLISKLSDLTGLEGEEKGLSIQEIGKMLSSSPSYDRTESFSLLAFEYYADIRLYPSQAQLLDRLINAHLSSEAKNRVIQLIMGGGKSKVLTPILAFEAADGDHISSVTVPDQLYGTNKQDIALSLKKMFGATLDVFEFDRNECNGERLRILYKQLLRARKEKTVLVTRPKDLLSVKLMLVERLENIRSMKESEDEDLEEYISIYREEVKLLRKIVSLMKGKLVNLIDEYDTINNPLNQLNFPLGIARDSNPTAIEEASRLYWEWLPEIEETLHLSENQQSEHNEGFHEEIKEKLLEKIFSKYREVFRQHGLKEEEMRAYLLGEKHAGSRDVYDRLQELRGTNREIKELCEVLAFYKHAMESELFSALQNVGNVHYGLSRRDSDFYLAIPWEKGEPKEGSRFRNYQETLFKTLQYYRHTWDRPDLTQKFIVYYLSQDSEKPEIKEKLNALMKILGLESFEGIDLEDPQKLENYTGKIQTFLKDSGQEVLQKNLFSMMQEFLSKKLIPDQLKIDAIQLTASPQDLMTLGKSNKGFSGTFADKDSWSPEVDVQETKGTDGKTVAALCQGGSLSKVNGPSLEDYLDDYMKIIVDKPKSSALIDLGAQFRDWDSEMVAQKLLEGFERKGINKQAVLCYVKDVHGEWVLALYRRGEKFPKFIDGSDPQSIREALGGIPKEQMFTYYDYAHIVGSDIPQPVPSVAICTINHKASADLILQAVMRMRKLGNFVQSAHFAVPQKVQDLVSKKLKKPQGEELKVHDLLAYGKIIQKEAERKRNFNAIIAQMKQVIKDDVERILLESESAQEGEEIYSFAREFYASSQNDNLFESLGAVDEELFSWDALDREKAKLFEFLGKENIPFKMDVADLQMKIEGVLSKHKKNATPLPKTITSSSQMIEENSRVEAQVQAKQKVRQKQRVQEEEFVYKGEERFIPVEPVTWKESLAEIKWERMIRKRGTARTQREELSNRVQRIMGQEGEYQNDRIFDLVNKISEDLEKSKEIRLKYNFDEVYKETTVEDIVKEIESRGEYLDRVREQIFSQPDSPSLFHFSDLKTGEEELGASCFSKDLLFTENLSLSFMSKGKTFLTPLGKPVHHLLVVQETDEQMKTKTKTIFLDLEESAHFSQKLSEKGDLGGKEMFLIEPHGETVQNGSKKWSNPFEKPVEENKNLRFQLVQALIFKGDAKRLKDEKIIETLSEWFETLNVNEKSYARNVFKQVLHLNPDHFDLYERSKELKKIFLF